MNLNDYRNCPVCFGIGKLPTERDTKRPPPLPKGVLIFPDDAQPDCSFCGGFGGIPCRHLCH